MARRNMPRGGGGGAPNMNALIQQAQKMQQDMAKKQEELAQREYSASAGGGAVTVTVNGEHEIKSIEISPAAVDPDDVEMLQDLIMAAVNEAMRTAAEAGADELNKLTGGLNLGF